MRTVKVKLILFVEGFWGIRRKSANLKSFLRDLNPFIEWVASKLSALFSPPSVYLTRRRKTTASHCRTQALLVMKVRSPFSLLCKFYKSWEKRFLGCFSKTSFPLAPPLEMERWTQDPLIVTCKNETLKVAMRRKTTHSVFFSVFFHLPPSSWLITYFLFRYWMVAE